MTMQRNSMDSSCVSIYVFNVTICRRMTGVFTVRAGARKKDAKRFRFGLHVLPIRRHPLYRCRPITYQGTGSALQILCLAGVLVAPGVFHLIFHCAHVINFHACPREKSS